MSQIIKLSRENETMIRLYAVYNNDNYNLQYVISDIVWLSYYK